MNKGKEFYRKQTFDLANRALPQLYYETYKSAKNAPLIAKCKPFVYRKQQQEILTAMSKDALVQAFIEGDLSKHTTRQLYQLKKEYRKRTSQKVA